MSTGFSPGTDQAGNSAISTTGDRPVVRHRFPPLQGLPHMGLRGLQPATVYGRRPKLEVTDPLGFARHLSCTPSKRVARCTLEPGDRDRLSSPAEILNRHTPRSKEICGCTLNQPESHVQIWLPQKYAVTCWEGLACSSWLKVRNGIFHLPKRLGISGWVLIWKIVMPGTEPFRSHVEPLGASI